jgi:small subunit ribosomal protein S16
LKRQGRTNRPSYRICVFDGRTRRDGRSIEDLGFYDTVQDREKSATKLDAERARYWISVGAKPSEIVHQIFKKNGVYAAAKDGA